MENVGGTHIFASMSGDWQVLVYSVSVRTRVKNAMVLPIPLKPGTADAIELIDLSAYPRFFTHLYEISQGMVRGGVTLSPPRELAVVRVGSFEASIVPDIRHFTKLSRRFALGASRFMPWRRPPVVEMMGAFYPDHAFVVYQFAPGEHRLHPFAFRFRSRYDRLFFPTRHMHQGDVPQAADFDHEVYAQRAQLHTRGPDTPQDRPELELPWFIERSQPIDYGRIQGMRMNEDTFADLWT
ncbi:hypothetical protein WME97_32675 [Sorangium sp. So ce367]|uniref:hypothetical protein n=1 Tax=Sorangium sp. So ce367 TaxID=3133305 RepID=UPI003F61E425